MAFGFPLEGVRETENMLRTLHMSSFDRDIVWETIYELELIVTMLLR